MEELTATVLAVLWRSEDRAHAVCRVRAIAGEAVTCIGPDCEDSPLAESLTYRFHGRWDDHPKFGKQFRFEAAILRPPVDRNGVIAYLVQLIDRIGQKRAERLWDLYGESATEQLRLDPSRAVTAGILSPDDAGVVQASLAKHAEHEQVRLELLTLTAGRGFGKRLIQEAIGLWGKEAARRVRANPWLLLLHELPGAGWRRTDKLYLDLGHPPQAHKRQVLAALAYLQEGHGDTWHRASRVVNAILEACGPETDPKHALRTAERWRKITIRREGEKHVALAEHARAEATLADKAKELLSWTRTPFDRVREALMRMSTRSQSA